MLPAGCEMIGVSKSCSCHDSAFSLADRVPHAPNRLNYSFGWRGVYLGAKEFHEHIQSVVFDLAVTITPDCFDQGLTSNNMTGSPHKIGQNIEFGFGKGDLRSPAPDFVLLQIQYQVRDL